MRKTKIMGILNLTPDSFSDGGEYNDLQKALKRAHQIEQEGADIIDLGGESTGPNSKNISLKEELNRVIPILKKLRPKTKLKISIDTYKSEVARQALELGADMINDVTALRADPKMANIIAQHKCPIILMYSKNSTPRTTTKDKKYSDVIKTIKTFLTQRISYAKKHGIHPSQIIIDPGMGQFISNLPKYSYEIIARLSELKSLKAQILLGHSRKSFLQVPMNKRDLLSQPLSAIASIQGASIIRTHDVKGTYKCLNSL